MQRVDSHPPNACGAHHDRQTNDKTERNVIDFFCAGSGGPNNYAGQDMLNTHRGMNISEQEFVSVLDDAMAALETCGLEVPVRNEVLGVLWSMKAEVVRV